MSLDDYIRRLLNLPPSSASGRGGEGHPEGGRGGRRSFDDEKQGENESVVRRADGLENFYDFDVFMRRQMESIFAPFFGGGRGARGGWDHEDLRHGFPSDPQSSDDQGERVLPTPCRRVWKVELGLHSRYREDIQRQNGERKR